MSSAGSTGLHLGSNIIRQRLSGKESLCAADAENCQNHHGRTLPQVKRFLSALSTDGAHEEFLQLSI